MDPVTASIIIGIAIASSVATGVIANNNNNAQIDQQNKLMQQQEQARQDQVRAEVGAAAQRTQTALASAANRGTAPGGTQFASIMGGMPSVAAATTSNGSSPVNNGSAGTF